MAESLSQLRYVLCPGSMPISDHFSTYQKIYKCWSDVWTEAFIELKTDKPLYSEVFTRQDYVGAIFNGNECISMGFFRWADARSLDFRKDSYFSNWSSHHIDQLTARGPKIIIVSQFTIHPRARGTGLGVSGKLLTMGILVETFLNSRADSMAGAGRKDRRVGETAAHWGAEIIDDKVPCEFGENNTDLLGYYKDKINAIPEPELKPLVRHLWKNRIVVPRVNVENEFLEANKSSIQHVA